MVLNFYTIHKNKNGFKKLEITFLSSHFSVSIQIKFNSFVSSLCAHVRLRIN